MIQVQKPSFSHSNFAHAYFAVMTDKIISRILASAWTSTRIIIHSFTWLEKFYFFFPFLKFSQALMVFSPFSLPWMWHVFIVLIYQNQNSVQLFIFLILTKQFVTKLKAWFIFLILQIIHGVMGFNKACKFCGKKK